MSVKAIDGVSDRVHAVRDVAAVKTASSPAAIRGALARAWVRNFGKVPSAGTLDVLTAHVSHETGRGDKMFNFNFGGIKGAGTSGTAHYMTREVDSNGSDKHLVDGFRAYGSIDDGANDYVHFLQHGYSGAVAAAEKGDADGFAAALKNKNYFTERLEPYQASMHALVHDPSAIGRTGAVTVTTEASVATATSTDPADYPTSIELARVLDAIGQMSARVAAPEDSQDSSKARTA